MTSLAQLFNKPQHSFPKADSTLAIPDAKVGIEVEVERWTGVNGTRWWDNHVDDSLRNNGQEFTTKGGLVGVQVGEAVSEICTLADNEGWSTGNPRAGIHIHVDCTDLDMEKGELAAFMSLYMIVEHMLFGYSGEWRRSCGFCDALEDSDSDFHYLGRALYDNTGKQLASVVLNGYLSKYQGINLLPLSRFGTVEFRQLPTTFDAQRIMDWINIILQIKNAAVKFDSTVPIIAQFSKQGAAQFVQNIMGGMWSVVQPFFREDRAWAAIDNAIALMSYGKVIVPKEAVSDEEIWDEDFNKVGAVVARKVEAAKLVKKPAKNVAKAIPADGEGNLIFPPPQALRTNRIVNPAWFQAPQEVGEGGAVQPQGELAQGATNPDVVRHIAAAQELMRNARRFNPEGEF